MKLSIDIKPAEIVELLDVLNRLVGQPNSAKPVAAPKNDEPTLEAIAAQLGLDPSKLEVVDIGNGLSAVKTKKAAQTTQPGEPVNDDKMVTLPNGDGTTSEYRYGDIPKNSQGQVKVRWLDEHCKCGNEKHGSDADYEFDDAEEADAEKAARADNPGGYL